MPWLDMCVRHWQQVTGAVADSGFRVSPWRGKHSQMDRGRALLHLAVTPPGRARSVATWPGRLKSVGCEAGSASARTAAALL